MRGPDERPRLLVVITLAETGGAQTYVAQLLPALTGRFDVTVAAYGPGPLREAAEAAGANFAPLRQVRRPLHPLRDLLGLLELVRLCRRVRPHVLHANSSKAGVLGRLAAALTRVPVRVFTVHGWAFKASSGAASTLYLLADRAMRPLTTAIVCVAEAERRLGIERGTCDAARTVVIRNAIDASALAQAPLAGDPPRLVSVGRLKEPKDFRTLVHALAQLGDVRLPALVAGDGPDRDELEAEAARLGVELQLAGDRDDVPALLVAADVFVLSSRSEGLPLSILEAMAAGLPVVATAVGGVPELVLDGRTGLLVPPGDADALAAALRRLATDAELRRRLGTAGRARVLSEFAIERFRREHLALYERELSARGLPLP